MIFAIYIACSNMNMNMYTTFDDRLQQLPGQASKITQDRLQKHLGHALTISSSEAGSSDAGEAEVDWIK